VGRVQLQQLPGGDRATKDRDETAMKTARAKAWCDRLADASGGFIAKYDCSQHIFATNASLYSESKPCR
jgi:hypothetical protein